MEIINRIRISKSKHANETSYARRTHIKVPSVHSLTQGRQCAYKRNIQARWRNHRCREKYKVLHMLSVRVRVNLSYPASKPHAPYYLTVACTAIEHFSTLSHKRHDFRKKKEY